MTDIIIADAHCDTLCKQSNEKCCFTFEYAKKYKGFLQVFAAFADTREYKPFSRAKELLIKGQTFINNNAALILQKKDLQNFLVNKGTAALFAVENGAALEGSLEKLDMLYSLGARLMTLTWNDDNEIAGGALSEKSLTRFGEKAVRKMNDMGVIVDVSHLNEKSLKSVLLKSSAPIIASHSASYTLCNNGRNIKDEFFKEILSGGGAVGICFYPLFITGNKTATAEDVIKHIEHFANISGGGGICLGSDFDGVPFLPYKLRNTNDYENLFLKMEKAGFDKKTIKKIAGENFIKFLLKTLH